MTTIQIREQADRNFIIVTGFVLLILLGIGLYLSPYWVNFPFIDDYQAIADFLNHTKTDSFTRLIGYTIWCPHNEHRIVFTRLTAAVYAYLSPDGVRFDVLSASGLLFRGLILWTIYREWQPSPIKTTTDNHWSTIGFAAVVFVITSGRDMENLLSATCALQNIPVVAWALLAFGAASRKHWTAAWGFGILAFLTSGNGIFVLLLLSIAHLIDRRWVIGSIAFTISIIFYVLYRREMNLGINLHQLAMVIPKFLAFQGSFFNFHYYLHEYTVAYTPITIVIGLIYVAVGLETLWSYRKGQISLFYPAVFSFIWLTALPTALLRPGVIESRFAIYSMVLTSIVYARLTHYVQVYRPKWLRVMHPSAVLTTLLLFVQSYVVFDRTIQRQYRTTMAEYYTFSHNTSAIYNEPRQKLIRLVKSGLYSTSQVERRTKEVFERNENTRLSKPASFGKYGNYFFVRTPVECTFILFRQGHNQTALPTDTHEDITPFTTFFMPSWLPKGNYSIELVNDEGVWPTNLSFRNLEGLPVQSPDECR